MLEEFIIQPLQGVGEYSSATFTDDRLTRRRELENKITILTFALSRSNASSSFNLFCACCLYLSASNSKSCYFYLSYWFIFWNSNRKFVISLVSMYKSCIPILSVLSKHM